MIIGNVTRNVRQEAFDIILVTIDSLVTALLRGVEQDQHLYKFCS